MYRFRKPVSIETVALTGLIALSLLCLMAASAGAQIVAQSNLSMNDGASNDNAGWSVSVSGNTMAIGASGHNSFQGAVYLYTNIGSRWIPQAELAAPDGAGGDRF